MALHSNYNPSGDVEGSLTRKRPAEVRAKISAGVTRSLLVQWRDPVIRTRRIAGIKGSWTPEKRARQSELLRRSKRSA
jgi:hypothetical protein